MYTRIKSIIDNILAYTKHIHDEIQLDIPFYAQWESSELVDDILNHKIEAKQDPKWKESGAISPDDYQYWSWNLCGTTCLKMILKYQTGKLYRLYDLAQIITKYGGYIPRENGIIDGLFYKPFINYLNKEHKLDASIASPLSIRRIQSELCRGNFVIVSVHQSIRDINNPDPVNKVGHLVLVTGYNRINNTISINNPSGSYQKSQLNHTLPVRDFLRFFSGRGIIINNKL